MTVETSPPTDDSPTVEPLAPNRRMRAATPIAAVALVALAASAILFTLPVTNPGVQRCGAPAMFLLKATSNKPLVDAEGKPINGWNTAQLRRADSHRCSKQVADRAVPAGMLLAGFWLLALVSVGLVLAGRWSLRRRPVDDP